MGNLEIEKSTEKSDCHGEQVPMDQMRQDECVIAPAAIYRKAN
jgi:hypothetical protein